MKRFTIGAMMAFVLVFGLALAALRNASDAWAGVLLCLTLLLLGAAILGAIYRRDGRQAYWVGFALFGCAYMLVQYVPKLWDQAVEPLPTAPLLAYLHERAHPRRSIATKYRVVAQYVTSNRIAGRAPVPVKRVSMQPVTVSVPVATAVPASESTIERAIRSMKITGNLDQFKRVGDCVFALLVALFGGWVARWFHRSSRVEQLGGGPQNPPNSVA
jgi:hypothetical protein